MVPEPQVESDRGSPTDMPNLNLTPEILAAALQGLEAQKARLDDQIAEVSRMLGARPQEPAPAAAPKPKRRMSGAGRKRVAAAQRKRWAEFHRQKAAAAKGAGKPAAAAKAPRPRRKLSAAGRRRIVEATRKRWAEFHRKKAEAVRAKGPAVKGKVAKKTAAKGKKKVVVTAATQPAAGSAVE